MKETFILEDLINALIELETVGEKFYQDLSDASADPETQKLFHFLSGQESVHKVIYQGFKNELSDVEEVEEEYNQYIRVLISHSFKMSSIQNKKFSLDEGIKLGLNLEKETLLFLNEMQSIVGEWNHVSIKKMVNEERGHIRMLLDYSKKIGK